jgi:hypothetical protein
MVSTQIRPNLVAVDRKVKREIGDGKSVSISIEGFE